jgi:hypothetical protein
VRIHAKASILTIGATTALALCAVTAPANAASSKTAPNPAGNGITSIVLDCGSAGSLTILTNNNHSSDMGGWSVGQVVGGGHLIPTQFTFSLAGVPAGTPYSTGTATTLFTGSSIKGGGNGNHNLTGSVVSCSAGIPSGMSVGDALAANGAPPVDPTLAAEDAYFVITVLAIPKP